jgi:hypothetical protein
MMGSQKAAVAVWLLLLGLVRRILRIRAQVEAAAAMIAVVNNRMLMAVRHPNTKCASMLILARRYQWKQKRYQ